MRAVVLLCFVCASLAHMASVDLVPSAELHVSSPTWWLESRFHFNFAGWNGGPENFGVLRVVNDDLVMPQAGFGRHPHRDMEIFSYIVDGELSHEDSMGNKESLGRGAVQYLIVVMGITHSEMNDGAERCRFLQIWIMPEKRGETPQYGSNKYPPQARRNTLLQILRGSRPAPEAAGVSCSAETVALKQDVNVYVTEQEPGFVQSYNLRDGRQIYLVCIEGKMKVNEVWLSARDAAKITASSATSVAFEAGAEGGHILFIEMPRA